MRALLGIYWAYCRLALAVELQYRAASLIYQISAVLGPLVYLTVWSAVARTGGGRVGGFSGGDFAAYFIALMLVARVTTSYVMWDYEYRIRNGTLSALLLRPVHPIHRDFVENATHNILMVVVLIPAALGLAALFQPAFHFTPWAAAAFVPALLLGFAVRFLVEWLLAITAFWLTRIGAIIQVYTALALFLSGQMTPLALLPAPLQALAAILPFRWMIAFPVELLIGRVTPGEALAGLAAQSIWAALSLAALHMLWRAGVRRYSAVGQ
jgi:ABC-2 type transport system permease protein